MQNAITDMCCSAMSKSTRKLEATSPLQAATLLFLAATLTFLPPASAKDSATANAVKVDDSAKTTGTQVKSYELKTNTRRSLRAAANRMQQAAIKDRSQTSSRKPAGKTSSEIAPPTVRSVTQFKRKSRTTLH